MFSERNTRIAKFRKVSGYLLWVSMPALILVSLGSLVMFILIAFKPVGDTGIIDIAVALTAKKDAVDWFFSAHLNWVAKILVLAVFIAGATLIISTLFQFQKLIECFYEGEIFNRKALQHGRKTFRLNLYTGYLFLGFQALATGIAIYATGLEIASRIAGFLGELLSFAISIGFYSLILWALEIGTDLNEESELTI